MNVNEIVTERIVKELEKGVIPWRRPWSTGSKWAVSRSTGKRYMLLNQMLLNPGEYLTFPEVKKLGGKVKKGEKGSFCVSWAKVPVKETVIDENGNEQEATRTVPRLRYYYVFEVSQCEGIERQYTTEAKTYENDPCEAAEKIITDYVTREAIHFTTTDGSEAYYQPASDSVVVPKRERFSKVEEFYSTTFHELTHSTMIAKRCNRKQEMKKASFGSKDYSKEELVAEIGAATLVNYTGLESEASFTNSAAYIQSWLKALKNDPNMLVSATARAEKAVNYILNINE